MCDLKPKFSIITTCLNEPRLERTCKSIVDQTYQSFEWIVIDGGSNQPTLDILQRYAHRMDYFVSEKDGGVYDAMNKGIERTSGERLNFLNAGDSYSDPDVLRTVNAFAGSLPDVDILHGKIRTDAGLVSFAPDSLFTKYMWVDGNILPHQAIFYQRDLFDRFGKYRTDFKLIGDGAFNMLLFFNNCTFKHVDCVVADYDTNGLSAKNEELSKTERARLVSEFFTDEEIATYGPICKFKRKQVRREAVLRLIRSTAKSSDES